MLVYCCWSSAVLRWADKLPLIGSRFNCARVATTRSSRVFELHQVLRRLLFALRVVEETISLITIAMATSAVFHRAKGSGAGDSAAPATCNGVVSYRKMLEEELERRRVAQAPRHLAERMLKVSLLEIIDVDLGTPSSPCTAEEPPLEDQLAETTPCRTDTPLNAELTAVEWRAQIVANCTRVRREVSALEQARAAVYARIEKKLSEEGVVEAGPQDVPLTDEMMGRIVAALRMPSQHVLAELLRLELTRNDLETLTGLNWLNDNVINFYLTLIAERSKERPSLPKVYAFNTFFVTTLEQKGYAGVRRWTKKIDLFAFDIALIPVHLGMHWCMAVVDMRDKTIKYYDSMGKRNERCLRDLRDYLAAEMNDKKREQLDVGQWKLINVAGLPQQNNGSDCGMFACKYAEYASRDARLNFTQADMPYFRKRMMLELLDRKLMQAVV